MQLLIGQIILIKIVKSNRYSTILCLKTLFYQYYLDFIRQKLKAI